MAPHRISLEGDGFITEALIEHLRKRPGINGGLIEVVISTVRFANAFAANLNAYVHPGELRVDDNPEIVAALFGLINLIVDNRIAEPKRIEALYTALPEGARRGIDKRDG